MKIEELFKKTNPEADYPQRASHGSAGFDIKSVANYVIKARDKGVIATGIQINYFPKKCYVRIASRSSLVKFNSVIVVGGVIDPDYTEEIHVLLFNQSDVDFEVKKGTE